VGLCAVACVWFLGAMLWPNPLKTVLANLPDDPALRIDALEDGLARCNPFDLGKITQARYGLMQLYTIRKRYEEAINQGRLLLRMPALRHDLENEVRVELAACLDFLGRAEEAEAERMAVADKLEDSPDTFVGWCANGKVLEKLYRYEEAVRAFEQALDRHTAENTAGRDEVLFRLALASFNAGWSEKTMMWAERVIAEGGSESWIYLAHRLAGSATSNLGRLDLAHDHRERAYEMAVKEGKPEKISDCLATLADLHHLRGDLVKAEEMCLHAESLCPGSARPAILYHAIILRAQGRLDEAVARLERASSLGVLMSSFHERRMQAVLNMNMATGRALLGRLDQAWDNLIAATGELGADPRLALVCEAAWACLIARRGDRESALARTELVLRELDEHPRDNSTRLECLEQLGQAMILTGEFKRAKECWERFLATTHPPVAEPTGRYHLGVCQWHLGDLDAARESFRGATAQGINSYHARLAEEKVRELSKAAGNEIL
jgi:tetratricopeptide (TPR) repeat protein